MDVGRSARKLAPAQLEAGMLTADPGAPMDWAWAPSRSDFGVTFRCGAGPLRRGRLLPFNRLLQDTLPSSQLPSPFCQGKGHVPQVPGVRTQTSFRGHESVYLTVFCGSKADSGFWKVPGERFDPPESELCVSCSPLLSSPQEEVPCAQLPGSCGTSSTTTLGVPVLLWARGQGTHLPHIEGRRPPRTGLQPGSS